MDPFLITPAPRLPGVLPELDAEGVVDEAVKVGLVGEGEVPLEDQSIMAGQNGDEGRGELGEERVRRVHGVLLQKGASATPF